MKQIGRAKPYVSPRIAVRGRRSKLGLNSAVPHVDVARRRSKAAHRESVALPGLGRRRPPAGRATAGVSSTGVLPASRTSRAKGAMHSLSSKGLVPSRATSRRGHAKSATQSSGAAAPLSEGTAILEVPSGSLLPSPSPRGEEATAHELSPSRSVSPLATVVSSLRQLHRNRQDYHSAEKRLTLQIKAIQRRTHARAGCTKALHAGCAGVYDIVTPTTIALDASRAPLVTQRKFYEREMQKAAKAIPVWPWAQAVRGFGALGLSQVIAECGDLNNYPSPAHVWKRMGVGRGHKDKAGPGGDETFYFGRSPVRRAILYCIGDCLIKAGGPLKTVYDERKVYEATKPACRRQFKTGGECFDEKTQTCRKAHLHNRAKRYMEKRLLRDLWRAWRNA